jgi:hypothetical protein
LAQRTRRATDASIERLLADGKILRTHVLRPTWHFVLPGDIRWMLALTGPRVAAAMAFSNRLYELNPKVFAQANDAFVRALEGGKHLTRTELVETLSDAKINAVAGERATRMFMQAELDAIICSGPRRGKQFTYALLDERAPPTAPVDRDEALAMLATRYFSTRSPATPQDFAWWSGLTVADAKRAAQAAGVRDSAKRTTPTDSVHLLPNYDELFIGYRDRSAILERVGNVKPLQRDAAPFANVIEIDGQVVGIWRRGLKRKSIDVELTYAANVSAAERKAVQTQVERYKSFIGDTAD